METYLNGLFNLNTEKKKLKPLNNKSAWDQAQFERRRANLLSKAIFSTLKNVLFPTYSHPITLFSKIDLNKWQICSVNKLKDSLDSYKR